MSRLLSSIICCCTQLLCHVLNQYYFLKSIPLMHEWYVALSLNFSTGLPLNSIFDLRFTSRFLLRGVCNAHVLESFWLLESSNSSKTARWNWLAWWLYLKLWRKNIWKKKMNFYGCFIQLELYLSNSILVNSMHNEVGNNPATCDACEWHLCVILSIGYFASIYAVKSHFVHVLQIPLE